MELSEETKQEIEQARDDFRKGKYITLAQFKKKLEQRVQ